MFTCLFIIVSSKYFLQASLYGCAHTHTQFVFVHLHHHSLILYNNFSKNYYYFLMIIRTADTTCDTSIDPTNSNQYIVWAIGGLGETAFRHFIRANGK